MVLVAVLGFGCVVLGKPFSSSSNVVPSLPLVSSDLTSGVVLPLTLRLGLDLVLGLVLVYFVK